MVAPSAKRPLAKAGTGTGRRRRPNRLGAWLTCLVSGSSLLAATGLLGVSPPLTGQAAASPALVQCLYEPTPPAPPPGGAVFARRAIPGSSSPNVVVVPEGESWTADSSCTTDDRAAAQEVMSHPTWVQVAAGSAVYFEDISHGPLGRPMPGPATSRLAGYTRSARSSSADTKRAGGARPLCLDVDSPGCLVSAWGAQDVTFADPVPDLFPGFAAFTAEEAYVVSADWLLTNLDSCRACSLAGVIFTPEELPNPDRVAFVGDLDHADLRDAWLDGTFTEWDFSGANLSGARIFGSSLAGAVLDHTTVSDTSFGDDDLRATRFAALRYTVPPAFTADTIGAWSRVPNFSPRCTTFLDVALADSVLTFRKPVGDCTKSPLFPGSSVPTDTLRTLAVLYHAQVDMAGTEFVSRSTDQAELAGTDLSGIDLDNTQFVGYPIDLSGADLDGASLEHASFEFARVAGASFHNVDAAGASFRGADLAGTGKLKAATFAGPGTDLQGADFVGADVSGASFTGADLNGAVFSRALAIDTDFDGVRAADADFNGAHIYGNAEAFDGATDLAGADFAGAVLAGNVDLGGGFDLTKTDLTGAKFDGADCIGCNFAGSKLTKVNFGGAYLPGAVFSGVLSMKGVNFVDAWLYCGDLSNGSCPAVAGHPGRWSWPLVLGAGEYFGPVAFATTNLKGVSLNDVATCPDGKAGATRPAGCDNDLLPDPGHAPALPPPCSAAGSGACPTPTSTLFDAGTTGAPTAVTPASPSAWAAPSPRQGYYASFEDGTVRLVGSGLAKIVAGQAGRHCGEPTAPCGDDGPATAALLGAPSSLAVGLDGSLYMADPSLHRVRRVTSSGQISTVAGNGKECVTGGCGDKGPATQAELQGPYGVWVSPGGELYIADGTRGVREVQPATGQITSINADGYDVRDVVGDLAGNLYATTDDPDYLIKIARTGQVSKVVGTGTSGYNGNTSLFGSLLPGTSVQLDDPQGLTIAPNGDIVFADTGNNLVRAYVPSSGHVVDVLAGVVSNGKPLKGFNGDGHWADQTQLDDPLSVAVGRNSLLVVADTGNHRVRQFGPSPLDGQSLGRNPNHEEGPPQ